MKGENGKGYSVAPNGVQRRGKAYKNAQLRFAGQAEKSGFGRGRRRSKAVMPPIKKQPYGK